MNTPFNKLSTIEFAKLVGQRPGMFFGDQITITSLQSLLLGFEMNTSSPSFPPFPYFNNWVKHKLNKFGPSYNWQVAILEACNNDERNAFDKFYELFEAFLLLKPKSITSAYLTEDNFAFYYNRENTYKSRRIVGAESRYVLEPAPYHIKLIEFEYCTHSYHYDYHFVVGENDKGNYAQQFDSLRKSKREYADKFGELKWQKADNKTIESTFESIVRHCNYF